MEKRRGGEGKIPSPGKDEEKKKEVKDTEEVEGEETRGVEEGGKEEKKRAIGGKEKGTRGVEERD